ncbi:MAG: aminoacyl-tRNA hydrolase [Chloroflexi bacterium]|nr:MAG: aminoacyl-tRNA hydrolase [Chloroflexota bacterium]RLC95368.1 MAG: aminoacyl-tRNA hydrolase [Chloroflexota bacterium]
MNLVIGLGNPGRGYAHTRHNVGFRCINHLGKVHGIPIKQRQCQAQIGIGRIDSAEAVLAKPRTFMNNSGKSVKLLMQRFSATPEDLIVIHDDLDLPLGRIRLYRGGGSGGHRGIESVIEYLGSRDFLRIRVGIGRPPHGVDPVDYVLSNFSSDEAATVEAAIVAVGEATASILRDGAQAAMNRYN